MFLELPEYGHLAALQAMSPNTVPGHAEAAVPENRDPRPRTERAEAKQRLWTRRLQSRQETRNQLFRLRL